MKRRNRDISIFNMSTIDLFACATGAFILLTLILLPYYLNIDRSILEVVSQLRGQLEDAEDALERVEQDLNACNLTLVDAKADIENLESELSDLQMSLRQSLAESRQLQQDVDACGQVEQRSFMLVLMSWETLDDVDLHIVDPNGERFYYNDRRSNQSVATFEEDSIRGPG